MISLLDAIIIIQIETKIHLKGTLSKFIFIGLNADNIRFENGRR